MIVPAQKITIVVAVKPVGLPTEALIAHVLLPKYGDHLPLYRQSQIYARSGLDLDRSTLAGWVGRAVFHLAPVVDRLAERLKQATHLVVDETRAPVLDPGLGRTRTGYLWAMARDERGWSGTGPPGFVVHYSDHCAKRGQRSFRLSVGQMLHDISSARVVWPADFDTAMRWQRPEEKV